MNKKALLAVIMIVLCVAGVGVIAIKAMNSDNSKALKKAVLKTSDSTVTLEKIVPFEWDSVYSFAPYTEKSRIEEVIGFKSDDIAESMNEGMVQLIFTKGNKVVCSVDGYESNLGYGIYLKDTEEDFSKVDFGDNKQFAVEKENTVVRLSETEN